MTPAPHRPPCPVDLGRLAAECALAAAYLHGLPPDTAFDADAARQLEALAAAGCRLWQAAAFHLEPGLCLDAAMTAAGASPPCDPAPLPDALADAIREGGTIDLAAAARRDEPMEGDPS